MEKNNDIESILGGLLYAWDTSPVPVDCYMEWLLGVKDCLEAIGYDTQDLEHRLTSYIRNQQKEWEEEGMPFSQDRKI